MLPQGVRRAINGGRPDRWEANSCAAGSGQELSERFPSGLPESGSQSLRDFPADGLLAKAPMKTLKKSLVAVAILVAALAGVGFVLPQTYHVERTVTIQAPADRIYPYISAFRRWPEWIAWTTNKYPDMTVKFGDADTAVGAGYSWAGKSSGNGAIRFTSLEPGKAIGYHLDFENGQYLSEGTITLVVEGAATKATWTNGGDLGNNPFSRWFGLLMDSMMGPDFETGLQNLKARVEGAK